MRRTYTIFLLVLCSSLIMCPGLLFLIQAGSQTQTGAISTPTPILHPQLNPSGTISIQSYYCSDFEDAPLKIYKQMTHFYFYFESTQLHYGLYLGAMFVASTADTVTLVIYAFVKTLTDYYVSSLGMTITYNLSGSYRGQNFQWNGSRSDTAPWIMGGACQCQFSLYSKNFTKDNRYFPLTLWIDYSLTSSEFSKSDIYTCSQDLPALTPAELRSAMLTLTLIIILSIVAIIGILITTTVIIRKRRVRGGVKQVEKHWAFSSSGDRPPDSDYDDFTKPPLVIQGRTLPHRIEKPLPKSISPIDLLTEEPEPSPSQTIEPKITPKKPDVDMSEANINRLIRATKTGSLDERLQAIDTLGKIGNKAAVPSLVQVLLYDKSEVARAEAATALGMLGDRDIMPILRRVLVEDPDPTVRNNIADAINLLEF